MLDAIEARRRELGMSVSELERAARLAGNYYSQLVRGQGTPRPGTIARLRLALQRYRHRLAAGSEDEFRMAIAYRMAIAIAAHALERDAAAVHASDPARRATQDPVWMEAAEVRRLAIYLLNTACGYRQTDVARAAGMTKQAVQLAVKEIEAEREPGTALDAMLSRLTDQIQGEW